MLLQQGNSDAATNDNTAPDVSKKARTEASSTFDVPTAESAADDSLNETGADDAKGAGGPRLKFLKSRFSLEEVKLSCSKIMV
jgi:hypothetical protein